jgi:hypothetical protein
VRSVSQVFQLALLAVCGVLLLGVLPGCATTQETAAEKQLESKRILEAREKRQKQKQKSKPNDHGSEQR